MIAEEWFKVLGRMNFSPFGVPLKGGAKSDIREKIKTLLLKKGV